MRVLCFAAALCLMPIVACAGGGGGHEKAVDTVVKVIRPSPGGDSYCATGVMVLEDTVLTAAHAIRSGPVEVVFAARDHKGAVIRRPSFYAGRGQPCRVVAVSQERGLALLRLVEPVDDVDVISLASASASPGEPVFSIRSGGAAALASRIRTGGAVIPGEIQSARGNRVQGAHPRNRHSFPSSGRRRIAGPE